MNLKHYAIFGTDFSVKGKLIKQLLAGNAPAEFQGLQGKNGLLFSETVLNDFIEEDYKHGNSALIPNENRALRTFSSGEKRKAFLQYLLSQKPDFLVLDNPFDSLDKASVAQLEEELEYISKTTVIIQVFNRKEDLLPFVDTVFKVKGEKIVESSNALGFLKNQKVSNFSEIKTIPPAPGTFQEIPEILVKMNNVSVSYEGKSILENISWEIKKGDFWQLIGPNGSGKTTLLSMIYGDNPKAYGVDLYLFGNKKGSGESVWEIKKKIGYFSPALIELFNRRNTVLEMIISGLVDSVGLYQKPSDKDVRLAREWLKILNLENKSGKIFTELSELHKRMVLIGRAMIKHPPLLILDEPTTSLDDKSALEITSLINLIAKESETAIVFVSHRTEKGLQPKAVYRLIPSKNGSKGEILVE
ncbi:ATP-binding cassette domain-containing protein [Salegentibacter salegens]|uniref:Molybdate transport system ATP-binding protein n=1 Tax=Salegentibacter salegens TaxID=143223 RepID=A0A1M7I5X5_9FLAO|nr:ATP-binding cassette domain-containing protein [Salegentibacter salegens]PRX38790.1 molybdate transport system ATP-binding protein [Salegentibacter salegens]SHM35933.1 molybdate transport system ATP-binding protein [Salegentibacter salegens]